MLTSGRSTTLLSAALALVAAACLVVFAIAASDTSRIGGSAPRVQAEHDPGAGAVISLAAGPDIGHDGDARSRPQDPEARVLGLRLDAPTDEPVAGRLAAADGPGRERDRDPGPRDNRSGGDEPDPGDDLDDPEDETEDGGAKASDDEDEAEDEKDGDDDDRHKVAKGKGHDKAKGNGHTKDDDEQGGSGDDAEDKDKDKGKGDEDSLGQDPLDPGASDEGTISDAGTEEDPAGTEEEVVYLP